MKNSGLIKEFKITSVSVAEVYENLFDNLCSIDINLTIHSKPQEIPDPVPFEQDTTQQIYDTELANNRWKILLTSKNILQRYHARFTGKTQPIGFMWQTFDLRDARYNGVTVEPTRINSSYLRRNAMNEGLIECSWRSGNTTYPCAAYYLFTYTQSKKIEHAKIKPAAAH